MTIVGLAPPPMGLIPSPTVERGHAQAASYWMATEDELVPELQFPNSISVYQRMMTDSQVKSVMRAVALPVLNTVFRLDPNGARDEVVAHVSANVGLPIKGASDVPVKLPRERDRFSWSQHIAWALLCIRYGFMPFEQVYRLDEATNRLWIRKLGPRWPKTITQIDIDRDGGLARMWQTPPAMPAGQTPASGGGNIDLDVTRLVVYVHEREGGSWVGNSLLRAAYRPWIIKDRMLRVWAMRDDRNSMGIPWYTASEDPADDELTKGESIARRVRAGDSSGGSGPFGSKLELLGVTGTLPDVEKQVRYQDEQIARSVLANFLNLGGQASTGSWALGTTFVDFFVQSLTGLAQLLADTSTQHVVEDLVDLNWGQDEPAPKVVFDPIGQNPSAIVAAVQMLIASGAIFPDPALDAFVRNLVGLPPKAPLPNATSAAGAAPPPAGSGTGTTT